MKVAYYLFTVFLGIILAVHLAMNGRVGAALSNPRVGNAVFWSIGALTAILIGLTGWRTGALDGAEDDFARPPHRGCTGRLPGICYRLDAAERWRAIHVYHA